MLKYFGDHFLAIRDPYCQRSDDLKTHFCELLYYDSIFKAGGSSCHIYDYRCEENDFQKIYEENIKKVIENKSKDSLQFVYYIRIQGKVNDVNVDLTFNDHESYLKYLHQNKLIKTANAIEEKNPRNNVVNMTSVNEKFGLFSSYKFASLKTDTEDLQNQIIKDDINSNRLG